MIHVVTATAAKQRNSFGVSFDLLAIGPYPRSHARREHEMGPGDAYAIPANVEHSIEIMEPAEEVQVFTPPREDFR